MEENRPVLENDASLPPDLVKMLRAEMSPALDELVHPTILDALARNQTRVITMGSYRADQTGHRDVHKGDFAEAWKLLSEVAEMDPWQNHHEDGYEIEVKGDECQFCLATRHELNDAWALQPARYDKELSKSMGKHTPDCLWTRTRVFLERFR